MYVVSIEQAVLVLNRIHEEDPTVLPDLIGYRVACNQALADDPTVQVSLVGGKLEVGLLGIINGIFGAQLEAPGFIAAVYDGDKKLSRFILMQ